MKIKTIEEVEKRLDKIIERYPLSLFNSKEQFVSYTTQYKEPFILKEKTIKQFVSNFLNKHNRHNVTKYRKKLTCIKNRRRSLGDIYRITKNYFPKAKLREVLQAILSLKTSLGSFNCPDIDKQVYYSTINRTHASNNIDSYKTDELGIEISSIFKDFDTENNRFTQYANNGRKIFKFGKEVDEEIQKYHLCSPRHKGHWKDQEAVRKHKLRMEEENLADELVNEGAQVYAHEIINPEPVEESMDASEGYTWYIMGNEER